MSISELSTSVSELLFCSSTNNMAEFSADNVIVTNCEPSELSDFLTWEELDLLLQPFAEGEELPIISSDAKVKAEDVDSFIDAERKQSTKAATARDIKNVQRWLWELLISRVTMYSGKFLS